LSGELRTPQEVKIIAFKKIINIIGLKGWQFVEGVFVYVSLELKQNE